MGEEAVFAGQAKQERIRANIRVIEQRGVEEPGGKGRGAGQDL